MYKYRVTCIAIKGKGNTKINQQTNCLKTFRMEVAKKNNVRVGEITLTYEEKEVCVP